MVTVMLCYSSRYFWLHGVPIQDPFKATVTQKVGHYCCGIFEKNWEDENGHLFFFFFKFSERHWLKEVNRKSTQLWLMTVLRWMQTMNEKKTSNTIVKIFKMENFINVSPVSHKQWKQLPAELPHPTSCQCHQDVSRAGPCFGGRLYLKCTWNSPMSKFLDVYYTSYFLLG